MKVLHSTAFLTPSAGQLTQLQWERASALALGLNWDTKVYCPAGAMQPSELTCFSSEVSASDRAGWLRKGPAWFRFRHAYHNWLQSMSDDYDVFVLRYYFHDPYQYAFVRRAKCPVYFVHHTLEVPEMFSSHSLPGYLRGVGDMLLGPATLRRANGIIGVTREIADYECARANLDKEHSFVYPNGVEYTNTVIDDNRSGIPEFLFVAGTFAVWHGLDDLLETLKISRENIRLHLVGHVPERERLTAQNDQRVVLHGSMGHAEIRTLAAACDLGLSSFRLDRNNMKQACTLKVRDYLSMGLPVYAGYEDIFPQKFPFFVNGPLDIGAMVAFANRCRNITRREVSDAARPYIEKQVLLRSLADFIARQERRGECPSA